jgi:hypothetical protein
MECLMETIILVNTLYVDMEYFWSFFVLLIIIKDKCNPKLSELWGYGV